jgi:hypothetical protein
VIRHRGCAPAFDGIGPADRSGCWRPRSPGERIGIEASSWRNSSNASPSAKTTMAVSRAVALMASRVTCPPAFRASAPVRRCRYRQDAARSAPAKLLGEPFRQFRDFGFPLASPRLVRIRQARPCGQQPLVVLIDQERRTFCEPLIRAIVWGVVMMRRTVRRARKVNAVPTLARRQAP